MGTKKILVIPGSKWQVPLVDKINNLGFESYTVNPFEDSPAFERANNHLVADIFDEQMVTNYCKSKQIDAVISDECDIAMPILAKYGSILNLNTLSEESATLFTDKFEMREFCKKNNIPTPEYKKCFTVNDGIEFLNKINNKLIMKPLDSNSSRGVFTVTTAKDIEEHFQEALSYSKVEKAVLFERYIDGIEFTIDGIKTPKKHFSLAISEKKHFKHNKNIASELYFSHINQQYDYDLLRKTNNSFVDQSPLTFGLTHAEYKYENGKFYLIEIAARGGGNLISSLIVPYMSGIDNQKYLIDCSLGNIKNIDFSVREEYSNRVAVLKFFDVPKNGRIVKGILNGDFLKNCPQILAYNFNFKIGDTIEAAKNDASRVGFYIACCQNRENLNTLMNYISNKVEIVVE